MPRLIDPDEPLVRTAVFGKQVEDFLTSDIGDYLLQKAKHDERDAIEDLIVAVGLLDERQIREIRARIYWARNFVQWLGEAVDMGHQSLEMLKEEDNG
jgi:hypothetical protein